MVERGMATSRLHLASVAALLLFGAATLPSSASAQSGGEDAAPVREYSLANISAVYGLRCDSLRRGKVKSREAMIYRSEAERVRGPARLASEQRYTQAEGAASAAFDESGRLKRRLERMVDSFVSAHRLKWYQTEDQAQKIRIEAKIKTALEIKAEGCS